MIEKLKKNKLLLQFSSFHLISSLAFSTIVPFLSLIFLDKGFSTSQITYFFAIFTFGIFLFSPVIGKISDIFGKKKLIIFGLFLEIFFFISYFFIKNLFIIYIFRFIEAIAYSSIFFVMIGAFEELIIEERGFWTGLFMSVGTIGSFLGPIMAGYIANILTNKILFLVSSFLIIISIFFIFFIYNFENQNKILTLKINKKINFEDFNPFKEIKHFLKFKELRGMALLGILMNSKGELYNIFFPILIVKTLGISKLYLGFFLAIPVFFHMFQFYFGRIGDNISNEFGVMFGVFLTSISIIYLSFVKNIYNLIFLLIIYGIGSSIWNVNAWSLMSNIASKYNIQGEIVGTYVSISKLGVFFSTLISAYFIELLGIKKILAYIGILIILSLIIIYFNFKPIFHTYRKKNIFYKIFN